MEMTLPRSVAGLRAIAPVSSCIEKRSFSVVEILNVSAMGKI